MCSFTHSLSNQLSRGTGHCCIYFPESQTKSLSHYECWPHVLTTLSPPNLLAVHSVVVFKCIRSSYLGNQPSEFSSEASIKNSMLAAFLNNISVTIVIKNL